MSTLTPRSLVLVDSKLTLWLELTLNLCLSY